VERVASVLLLGRLVLGGIMAGHRLQKLFG
jgi:hypothetical protein